MRELKAGKAEKAKIDVEVQLLKDLKKKLSLVTGEQPEEKGKKKNKPKKK